MTTRLSNPTYKPEVGTKVTLINFSVKQSGLEEQLLGVLLKSEGNIEKQRIECIETESRCQGTLRHLESEILRMLQESTGP